MSARTTMPPGAWADLRHEYGTSLRCSVVACRPFPGESATDYRRRVLVGAARIARLTKDGIIAARERAS